MEPVSAGSAQVIVNRAVLIWKLAQMDILTIRASGGLGGSTTTDQGVSMRTGSRVTDVPPAVLDHRKFAHWLGSLTTNGRWIGLSGGTRQQLRRRPVGGLTCLDGPVDRE